MLRLGFGADYKGRELLQATFDSDQSGKVRVYAPNFENELEIGTRLNVLRLLGNTTRTVQFDFAAIMRKRNPSNMRAAMQASSQVLHALVNSASRDDNPKIFAEFCGRYTCDPSRASLHAELRWPDVTDERLWTIVTPRMQRVAKAIKLYKDDRVTRQEVNVDVDSATANLGFNVHLFGTSMLATSGRARQMHAGDTIHVSPANLYSDEMAIVAFAGAVAFAYAGELEPLPQI